MKNLFSLQPFHRGELKRGFYVDITSEHFVQLFSPVHNDLTMESLEKKEVLTFNDLALADLDYMFIISQEKLNNGLNQVFASVNWSNVKSMSITFERTNMRIYITLVAPYNSIFSNASGCRFLH